MNNKQNVSHKKKSFRRIQLGKVRISGEILLG